MKLSHKLPPEAREVLEESVRCLRLLGIGPEGITGITSDGEPFPVNLQGAETVTTSLEEVLLADDFTEYTDVP